MDTRLDNPTRTRTIWRKIHKRLFGYVSLRTNTPKRGNALISYLTEPFLRWPGEGLPTTHSSYSECREIAKILLDEGYHVDVIQWDDETFIPKKSYSLAIDVQRNLGRLAAHLPEDCIKIAHIVSSYWKFQNDAEKKRLADLFTRKGIRIRPRRTCTPSENIFVADFMSGVGTATTFSTYPDVGKKIIPIPLSSNVSFPSPAGKDFAAVRKNFVWIGGGGAVHKGLDLLLEVFSEMPEYALTVLGPIFAENDFVELYKNEILHVPNIHAFGRIDPSSKTFRSVINSSVALIYPSSSEGQAGSVVTAMHAGLIPIVSKNAGVDVNGFGIMLEHCTKEEIRECILNVSRMTPTELMVRAGHAWEVARRKHTLGTFRGAYENFIRGVIGSSDQQ